MRFVFLIILLFSSLRVQAISDLDRAVLFGANAVSMVLYIAKIESEIARMQLNYKRKSAEFQKQLELDHQGLLKKIISEEIILAKSQLSEYSALHTSVTRRSQGYGAILDISRKVYTVRLKVQSIDKSIAELDKAFPGIQNDWSEIVENHLKSARSEASVDIFEVILTDVTSLYMETKKLEQEIQLNMDSLLFKISSLETQLRGTN